MANRTVATNRTIIHSFQSESIPEKKKINKNTLYIKEGEEIKTNTICTLDTNYNNIRNTVDNNEEKLKRAKICEQNATGKDCIISQQDDIIYSNRTEELQSGSTTSVSSTSGSKANDSPNKEYKNNIICQQNPELRNKQFYESLEWYKEYNDITKEIDTLSTDTTNTLIDLTKDKSNNQDEEECRNRQQETRSVRRYQHQRKVQEDDNDKSKKYNYLLEQNKEQRKAVQSPLVPMMILAPAGSGKTKTLQSRILHCIVNDIPPQNILAITFTRKAANEMRQRQCTSIGVSRSSQLTICNFHQQCLRQLRKYYKQAGFPSPFYILSGSEQQYLLMECYAEYVAENSKNTHLLNVNEVDATITTTADTANNSNKIKIENDNELLLENIEPTIPKLQLDSTNIKYETIYTINSPSKVKATTTNTIIDDEEDTFQQIGEMRLEDFVDLQELDQQGINIPGSLNQYAEAFLTRYRQKNQFEQQKKVPINERSINCPKEQKNMLIWFHENKKEIYKTLYVINNDISRQKSYGYILDIWKDIIDTDNSIEKEKIYKLISSQDTDMAIILYEKYNKKQRQYNFIDFSDMVPLVNRLLLKYEDITRYLNDIYVYIFVDEFQDVSNDQWSLQYNLICLDKCKMCKQVIYDKTKTIATNNNTIDNNNTNDEYTIYKCTKCNIDNVPISQTVVGDDDQAIYGFRGGSGQSFQHFFKTFPKIYKDHMAICQRQVYRNVPKIQQVAKTMISYNTYRYPKYMISTNNNNTESSQIPQYGICCNSLQDEIQECLKEISRQHIEQKIPWKDIAIISRTKKIAKEFQNGLNTSNEQQYELQRKQLENKINTKNNIDTTTNNRSSSSNNSDITKKQNQKEIYDIYNILHQININRYGKMQEKYQQQIFCCNSNGQLFQQQLRAIQNIPSRGFSNTCIRKICDTQYRIYFCDISPNTNEIKGERSNNIHNVRIMVQNGQEKCTVQEICSMQKRQSIGEKIMDCRQNSKQCQSQKQFLQGYHQCKNYITAVNQQQEEAYDSICNNSSIGTNTTNNAVGTNIANNAVDTNIANNTVDTNIANNTVDTNIANNAVDTSNTNNTVGINTDNNTVSINTDNNTVNRNITTNAVNTHRKEINQDIFHGICSIRSDKRQEKQIDPPVQGCTKFVNLRNIILCIEVYIQKPTWEKAGISQSNIISPIYQEMHECIRYWCEQAKHFDIQHREYFLRIQRYCNNDMIQNATTTANNISQQESKYPNCIASDEVFNIFQQYIKMVQQEQEDMNHDLVTQRNTLEISDGQRMIRLYERYNNNKKNYRIDKDKDKQYIQIPKYILKHIREEIMDVEDTQKHTKVYNEEASKKTIKTIQDLNDGSITVTTIHQAKGLEWPIVFVVGFQEGHLPILVPSLYSFQEPERHRITPRLLAKEEPNILYVERGGIIEKLIYSNDKKNTIENSAIYTECGTNIIGYKVDKNWNNTDIPINAKKIIYKEPIMSKYFNIDQDKIDTNEKQIENHIESERRLAYVAQTRAKKSVYISYNQHVTESSYDIRSVISPPSRFLFEMYPSPMIGNILHEKLMRCICSDDNRPNDFNKVLNIIGTDNTVSVAGNGNPSDEAKEVTNAAKRGRYLRRQGQFKK